jgi:hypothetical protein
MKLAHSLISTAFRKIQGSNINAGQCHVSTFRYLVVAKRITEVWNFAEAEKGRDSGRMTFIRELMLSCRPHDVPKPSK